MGLGTWESYLANHIEGFFNKKFSSSLEAVELMNGLQWVQIDLEKECEIYAIARGGRISTRHSSSR